MKTKKIYKKQNVIQNKYENKNKIEFRRNMKIQKKNIQEKKNWKKYRKRVLFFYFYRVFFRLYFIC